MFWNAINNVAKTAQAVQRIAISVAATIVITIGLYDFVRQRRKNKEK